MTTTRWIETVIVAAMFGGYLGLWRCKRARHTRRTGVDPEVLQRAKTPVQRYFAAVSRALAAASLTPTTPFDQQLDDSDVDW